MLIPLALLFGLFLSNTARRRVKKSEGMLRGRKLTVVAFILNCLFAALIILPILMGVLANTLHSLRHRTGYYALPRSACVNYLKQLALVFNLYATENGDMYPPIDGVKNNFMFDGDVLYPEYLTDVAIVACPGDPVFDPEKNFRLRSTGAHPESTVGVAHPDCITDMSYVYLGWLVMSDEEAEAFFEAYDKLSPDDYDKDIIVPDGSGNAGGTVIHRLQLDADRFLGEETGLDPEYPGSEVPIAWDRPYVDPSRFSHQPAGGNVVYLDGHVDFIKYGEKFPMTEAFAKLLDEREREPIQDCDG